MALTEVVLEPGDAPEDPRVRALLEEATRRVDAFVERRSRDPIPGFVPCDFAAVYRTLRAIRERWLAPGDLFLEWGSGLGVVAMVARELGFQAYGIEIHADLVHEAERLARDRGVDVRFVVGSFVPEGGDDLVPAMDEFTWLETDAESAYDELGFEPDEFDVVFAYPWPGEEDVVLRLFERYAARGALLVTYRGREEVHVHRKTRAASTRRRRR